MVVCCACGLVLAERLRVIDADWGIEEGPRAEPASCLGSFIAPPRGRDACSGSLVGAQPGEGGARARDAMNWLNDRADVVSRAEDAEIRAMIDSQQFPESLHDVAVAAYRRFVVVRKRDSLPMVRGCNKQALYAACIYEAARAQGMGISMEPFLASQRISRRMFCTQHKMLLIDANVQVAGSSGVTPQALASETAVCIAKLALSNADENRLQSYIEELCEKAPLFKPITPALKVGSALIILCALGRIKAHNVCLVARRLGCTREVLMKRAKWLQTQI